MHSAGNKQLEIIGAQFASSQSERSASCGGVSVFKCSTDSRTEDLESLEVEYRDVTDVAVLGYN